MKPLHRIVSFCLFSVLWLAATAHGNTVQDRLGVGSRSKSMGGVGTASADDGSAVYYNPARLSACQENRFAVEVSHLGYALDVDVERGDIEPIEPNDRTAVSFFSCLHLPYRLSVGLILDTGLQTAQNLKQRTLNGDPEFVHYGQSLEQLSILGAVAFKISDRVSVGLGGALLVRSALDFGVRVPVVTGTEELESGVEWNLHPAAALYGGVQVQPVPELVLAASFRTSLFHLLEGTAQTQAVLAGVLVDIDLNIESVTWYSPLQVSVGAAYTWHQFLVSGDVTWYQYSKDPGTFIHVTPVNEDDFAAGLNYPPKEETGYKDVFAPRFGVEYTASESVQVRAGVGVLPSAVPAAKAGTRANNLEGTVSTLSAGVGYRIDSESPNNAPAGDETGSGLVSLHARFHQMSQKSVDKGQDDVAYRFGGQLWDIGVTFSLAW